MGFFTTFANVKRGLLLLLLGLMSLLYAAADARSTAQEPCGNVSASLCQGNEGAFAPPGAPLFAMPGSWSTIQLSEAGTYAAKPRPSVLCPEQTAYQTARMRIYRSVRLRGTPRTTGYLTGRPADRYLYPFRKIVI